MRFKPLAILALAAASALAFTNPAHAVTVSYAYVAGQANYAVTPGGTLDVPVYLREVTVAGPAETAASLLDTEQGLFGAGLTVDRTSGAGVAAFTGVSSPFTSLFTSDVTPASVTFLGAVELGSPGATADESLTTIASDAAGSTTTKFVLLGTLHLSGLGDGEATFAVGPNLSLGVGGSTLTYATPYDLDLGSTAGTLFAPAAASTFNVSVAVPEPASLATIAGVLGGFAMRRRRRID